MLKVCGMRDAANIRDVERLGPDLMGFIFWPRSSRYVAAVPGYMPTSCRRVGVFVDEDIERVCDTADAFGLHVIQLHGHESPDYILRLRHAAASLPHVVGQGGEPAVIKAFSIATVGDLALTAPYTGVADMLLFDTKAQLPGGTGCCFDWSVLNAYEGDTPFLLSGGIGPDDVPRLQAFCQTCPGHVAECLAGIDINSRFETAPAMKDVHMLRCFFDRLGRTTEHNKPQKQ